MQGKKSQSARRGGPCLSSQHLGGRGERITRVGGQPALYRETCHAHSASLSHTHTRPHARVHTHTGSLPSAAAGPTVLQETGGRVDTCEQQWRREGSGSVQSRSLTS